VLVGRAPSGNLEKVGRSRGLWVEGSTLQEVTAASSGAHTHTHAGGKGKRLAWCCLARPSAGCGGYRRGAAEITAGFLNVGADDACPGKIPGRGLA